MPSGTSGIAGEIRFDGVAADTGRVQRMLDLMSARGPDDDGLVAQGAVALGHRRLAIVDLSERRSQFVSSVTHELKTPLTNIRMYIEMLEQGVARDTDREQDYLRVVGSESARLSRLINNVLELSRLENNQRRFDMQPGNFKEVLDEVQAVMAEKLRQEGFTLSVPPFDVPAFPYDREVMVQLLINLIENSIKFGRQSKIRRITVSLEAIDRELSIRVVYTAVGIVRQHLDHHRKAQRGNAKVIAAHFEHRQAR
mgnify:CR=1 FL=1